MKRMHDTIWNGHLGVDKTSQKLRVRFFWPYQDKDVREYIKKCDVCAMIKEPQAYFRAELKPIKPTRPFQLVTTDLMGPLPTTKSNNKHILVAIDHFSKWAEFFALPNQEARTVANCLVLVFCRHGGFEQLHSDQGKNYQSNLIKEFCEILDIHQTRTTAFHAMEKNE